VPRVATMSPNDRSRLIGDCMKSAGLAIEVTSEDGNVGFSYDVRVVSAELVDDTMTRCEADLVARGAISELKSGDPEFLAAQYARMLAEAECLRELGLIVKEPSTEAAFIESKGAAWDPFTELLDSVSADKRDAALACFA
jgi:hypothetical protein